VAIAIAKAANGRVTALHVAQPPEEGDLLLRHRSERRLRTGRALVGEVQTLGQREGVPVTARVLTRRGQEAVILRQAERGGHNLMVLGVQARPSGERLFFGHSSAVLIERSPCAVLVVTS
jgi:nucleotide-binding universal stress UspA family protein